MNSISELPTANSLLGDELIEVSQLSVTTRIVVNTISALASDNSFNDSAGGFITSGFSIGDRVNVTGFSNIANNIVSGVIVTLTANKMTIGGIEGDAIVDSAAGNAVVIAKWTSRRAFSDDLRDVKVLYKDPTAYFLPTGVTTTQTLVSYTVPANTLKNNGDMIIVRAWGGFTTAGGGTRQYLLRVEQGVNFISNGLFTTLEPRGIHIEAWIIRLSSTAVRYISRPIASATLYGSSTAIEAGNSFQFAGNIVINADSPFTISAVGSSNLAGAGAVECRFFHVELHK